MKMPKFIDASMIAPCGINCLACDAHLSVEKPCPGCRAPREQITRKSCRECSRKKCAFEQGLKFCFECEKFPCLSIKTLNSRYMNKYNVNLIENGNDANWNMDRFLDSQKYFFTCSCGGIINQHRKACSDCGKASNMVALIMQERIDNGSVYHLLDHDDFKDKKNLIEKLIIFYGNEHIFKHAMLMLLEEREKDATAFGLFFGYQKEPMTLKAISEQMNISTTRVRTLSDRAFRHLIAPGFRKRVWEACGYKEPPKP